MGIHTAVFNKSYIWTTLADHITRSDEEIMQLCGVNLVFLGPTKYGILRDICRPNSGVHVNPAIAPTPKPSQVSHPWNKKTTCHKSTHGRTMIHKRRHGHGHGKGANQGNRPQTLSESRSQNYSITTPLASTHDLRSSHQQIDYLSLNDGLEEDIPLSPKRQKKTTHRPRSAPSATRVAAHKSYSSPEAEEIANKQSLSGVPARPTGTGVLSGIPASSGIPPATLSRPTSSEELPDLVVNHNTENTEVDAENENVVDPASTEEELEAADILLSLGEVCDDTLDEEDNFLLSSISLQLCFIC